MYILLEGEEEDTDRKKEEEEEELALAYCCCCCCWQAEKKEEEAGGHAVMASPRKMADGSTMPELLPLPLPPPCWLIPAGSMSR
jgi:hypothetical protein